MASATKSRIGSQSSPSNEPVFARRHRRLQVAVWQNDTPKGTFFNVSLQRSYKDGESWKRNQASLNRDDLLVAAKLLDWAHSAIVFAVTNDSTPPTAKQPVNSQRHRNLEAAVWRQEGDQGAFFTVSLKRSYKVDDEWNDSSISLGNTDLLPMARLLDRAHDAIDDLYEDGNFGPVEPPSNGSSSGDVSF